MVDGDHEELEGLLGAYALDAVDAEEAARVESHLEVCPRCRAEVDADREVAGHLGTSTRVGEAEPLPEGLWDRIAGGLAPGGRDRGPGPGAGRADPATVVDISAAPSRWRRGPGRWVALAGAAAVAAIAVLGVRLAQVDHPAPTGPAAAVRAALGTPTHRLVRLDAAGGAQVAEFVLLRDGQGYLVSSSMAALPSDETYQLWAVVDDRTISMGLLGRHPRQAAFTVASSAVPSELAVTVEPAGGVSVPDRRPVAEGKFA